MKAPRIREPPFEEGKVDDFEVNQGRAGDRYGMHNTYGRYMCRRRLLLPMNHTRCLIQFRVWPLLSDHHDRISALPPFGVLRGVGSVTIGFQLKSKSVTIVLSLVHP